LQRICYAAGIKPDEFYSATLDELILFIKGCVDNWRYQRIGVLYCGNIKEGSTVTDLYALPFDDEYEADEISEEDLPAFYDSQMKLVNEWKNKKNG